MGHERSSTTLDLYARRTDDPTRSLRVLEGDDEEDEDGRGWCLRRPLAGDLGQCWSISLLYSAAVQLRLCADRD